MGKTPSHIFNNPRSSIKLGSVSDPSSTIRANLYEPSYQP